MPLLVCELYQSQDLPALFISVCPVNAHKRQQVETLRTPIILFQDCVSSSVQSSHCLNPPCLWGTRRQVVTCVHSTSNAPGTGQIVPGHVCVRLRGLVNAVSDPHINPPLLCVKGHLVNSSKIDCVPATCGQSSGCCGQSGSQGEGGWALRDSQPGATIVSQWRRAPLISAASSRTPSSSG